MNGQPYNAIPIFFQMRELWNGWLVVLMAFATVLLAMVIVRAWYAGRKTNIPPLVGFWFILLGETVRSGWSWVLFRILNDFGDRSPVYMRYVARWWISGFGVLLMCAGLLVSIYCLSPGKWKHRNLIVVAAILVVFSFVSWNYRDL